MLDPTIGRTPLLPAPLLASRLGLDRVFAKYERANPSGLHKDRSALAMVAEARGRGITVGTCGSVGLALARLAGRSATVFVPARYAGAPVEAMKALGARVVRTEGSYEDAVEASARFAALEGAYDANPTGTGGAASLRAYEAIAEEIVAEVGWVDSVWVPAGNGTTLAGIARGFVRLAAAAERLSPRVCGAGSAGNTAVVESIRAGRVIELDPRDLRETPANEPLLNWRSAHAREALEAVQATGGTAFAATDDQLREAVRMLDADGIAATPAAAAAAAGLASSGFVGGTHVVVLTS